AVQHEHVVAPEAAGVGVAVLAILCDQPKNSQRLEVVHQRLGCTARKDDFVRGISHGSPLRIWPHSRSPARPPRGGWPRGTRDGTARNGLAAAELSRPMTAGR